MDWTLPEPILAAAVNGPRLPARMAAEPKWDGYRALLGHSADGRIVIRSRRGTDMTEAFPEIALAAGALPADVVLDGELIVWENGRLAFERLQGRLHRRRTTTASLAAKWPAHFVAFDLLHHTGTDLMSRPYAERREALEQLFTEHELGPSLTLCPSTTDPQIAAQWLDWSAVGMEGLVFKRLAQSYRPGERGWQKYRMRATTEAIVGAVSGSLSAPVTVLLGRLDAAGRLQYVGRSAVLSRPAGLALADQLAPAAGRHPWTGMTFSTTWGSQEKLKVEFVEPVTVAEVAAEVSVDPSGRWRHPVRWTRVRADLAPGDVPLFEAGNEPAAG
ncbi:ATP-dependent DNA ligase [Streptomyces sp. H39-S7]|uniref:ATP-dependent DNA ligase n=1 Tax=Streptomyces sp. H39-S7 TaxID=3004357 RepID=UPI0022AF3C05|nr:ATP-dependent DNA ligase [Streptomyces sp. H39-S7]MCZ4119868.1 ATP-dependent DNA ligase [Streptomyces sp. H39-S7]